MAKYSPKTKEELEELVGDESVNLGDIDTSAITDMSYLFESSEREDFSGIEKWDTSRVTDMKNMFSYAKNFNHNINDWNVSNVEDMESMFECSSFNQPLDKWDTSSVKIMDCMFMDAEQFNQDISKWNTNKVARMEAIFLRAKSFNQNLDDWNTWSLMNVARMLNFSALAYNPPKWYFEYQEAYLKRWTDYYEDIESEMEDLQDEPQYKPKNLDELKNLVANKFIHLGNIDTSAITDMSFLFDESSRTNFDGIEKWDTSNVTNMEDMFYCAEKFDANIDNWNVSKVECMGEIFIGTPLENNPPKWYKTNE